MEVIEKFVNSFEIEHEMFTRELIIFGGVTKTINSGNLSAPKFKLTKSN